MTPEIHPFLQKFVTIDCHPLFGMRIRLITLLFPMCCKRTGDKLAFQYSGVVDGMRDLQRLVLR